MGDSPSPAFVDFSFRDAISHTFPGSRLPGPKVGGSGLRVVMGAGSVNPSDWICLDMRSDYPEGTDLRWKGARKLGRGQIRCDLVNERLSDVDRLGEGTCSAIYAHHVVEHLPVAAQAKVLREWARMLEPGGLLYLNQPDLAAVCARTLEGIEPGSAKAWFDAKPKSRTWEGDDVRGLDPVAWQGDSFGAWEWFYCGGEHLSVPSEQAIRAALEAEGLEVRKAEVDLSTVPEAFRLFVSLCATYVARK